MKISKINKVKLDTPKDIFCVSTKDHKLVVRKDETSFNTYNCNLSLVFASSAFAFANDSLLNEWSLEDCKDYIKENHLQKSQESLYQNLMQDSTSTQSREDRFNFSLYWACAVDIRKKFFNTYSTLETWHEEVKAKAKKNGYVRSEYGPFRRLPRLLYVGRDDKAKEKNLYNISLNSPIQSWEACYVLGNIPKLMKKMRERGLKSRIFNNIHDSIMLYIHKDELQIMKELMIEVYHKDFELAYGIPYILEYSYVNTENDDVWGIQETDF